LLVSELGEKKNQAQKRTRHPATPTMIAFFVLAIIVTLRCFTFFNLYDRLPKSLRHRLKSDLPKLDRGLALQALALGRSENRARFVSP
jgi:hypothetical protein